jgi:hypothetical protein
MQGNWMEDVDTILISGRMQKIIFPYQWFNKRKLRISITETAKLEIRKSYWLSRDQP